MAQEMSIQNYCVTHLKSAHNTKFISLEIFTAARVYFMAHELYRSTQHHDYNVQESTVSWPVCTGAHCIMTSIYKRVQYHGQCVQEHTAS